MNVPQERIDALIERLDKAHQFYETQIETIEAQDKLILDARSLILSLDIKLAKLREQLQ